jgi:acyl-CoA thioesterase-1
LKKNFSLYGALLLLFQVLAGCDAAPPPIEAENAGRAITSEASEPTRLVVAFGDSLYAGYRLDAKDGFAPVLQAALRSKGFAVSVLNAGVSGDTTFAGKARLAFVLDNAPQEVEMVILGLGGNDMLRGIKPEETRANLTAMLEDLKRRNIEVVLTGMVAAPNLGPDYAAKFNAIFPDLAKQYGAPLYPFFLDGVVTDGALMLPDGIHPNKQGVAKVVVGIEPVVASALAAIE